MSYGVPNIQGWMSDEAMLWLYDQARGVSSVVEIGSWKGRSTHALLSGCPGPVFAVDHFYGSAGELAGAHMEALCGGIYEQFIENVGSFPNLSVLRMESTEAAKYVADGAVDMVFIDGSHDKADVVADLKAWRPKCRRLLCGHDASYHTVREAIAECGLPFHEVPNIGIWRIDIGTT